MKVHLKFWEEPLQKVLEKNNSEQVLLVPGHCFFIDVTELDLDILENEIPEFLELKLEEIAPFPIEKLLWGYLISENKEEAILYATTQELLENEGISGIEDYLYVLPNFLSICQAHVSSPEAKTFLIDGKYLLASYLPNDELATSLQYILEDEIDYLTHIVPDEYTLSETLVVETNSKTREDNSVDISIWSGESSLGNVNLTENQSVAADIRDSGYLNSQKANRARQNKYWKLVQYAGMVAILLLLLEISLFSWSVYTKIQSDKIAGNQDRVSAIEVKNELVLELERATEDEITPLQTLALVNQSRPLDILFKQVQTDENNITSIQGEAINASTVTKYTEELQRAFPSSQLELKSINTRNGKTFFTLQINTLQNPDLSANSDYRRIPAI